MAAYVIRPLTEADAAQYQRFRVAMLALHPEAFSSSADEEERRPLDWSEKRLRADATKPHEHFLGAFAEGQLIGTAGLEGRYRPKERHNATVRGVMVDPAWRGQGVARALMEALLAHARQLPQLRQVDLTVTQGNGRPQALYESLGFRVFGVHPAAICVDGVYHAKVLMALWLDPMTAPKTP